MVTLLKIVAIVLSLLFAFQAFRYQQTVPDSKTDLVNSFALERTELSKSLSLFTQAPHPMGSERQVEIRDHLVSRLKALHLEPVVQNFTAQTPNPDANLLVS